MERMFEREIAEPDVLDVMQNGQTVEEYSDDLPYPSQLLLGWCGGRACVRYTWWRHTIPQVACA